MFLSLAFGGFREVVPLLFNRDLAHWSLPEVQRQGSIMQNLSSVILDCLSGSRLGTRQYFCGPVEHCGKPGGGTASRLADCQSVRLFRASQPQTAAQHYPALWQFLWGPMKPEDAVVFTDHFRRGLRAQMARATIAGQLDVLINCGRLYRSLGGYPGFIHGMPLCCDAMQAEFKPGDTMILDRTNGAGMTVRYLLPLPK
jgi:hypothetical protein